MCRDKSPDPIERQAEMFSASLLMPRDDVRARLPASRWTGWGPVHKLADEFVVSPTAMAIRLEEFGWAHRDVAGVPASGPMVPHGQGELFPEAVTPHRGGLTTSYPGVMSATEVRSCRWEPRLCWAR
ncbi:MAG: ImmA/IrrE family metallo-endopeptidase [Chloroflexi bacterium]|nr:ImmA/IrrE family metallo-endopeptidase [Chloroflexota bacterium]